MTKIMEPIDSAWGRWAKGLQRFKPSECPHCEYDRKFPETQGGGWIYTGNNGPIVCCPMCNPDGSHPRR